VTRTVITGGLTPRENFGSETNPNLSELLPIDCSQIYTIRCLKVSVALE
jgi:hypothetical protein